MLLFTLVSAIIPAYATVIDLTPALTGDASEILYEYIDSAFVKIASRRNLSQRDLSKIYCGECYVNILVYLLGDD